MTAEPNDLSLIQDLRPEGRRRLVETIPPDFQNRLRGALLGRCAGCMLGSPVEMYNSGGSQSVGRMARWAAEIGDDFPPVDYWSRVENEDAPRAKLGVTRGAYSREGLVCVQPDDDIAYTILGLLILEASGSDFALPDVAAAWLSYVPHAATAEEVALANLRAGVSAEEAGERDNPFDEFIGADIRADPWGYAAPGWPEKAAAMAYTDAYLTHRRNGIYGSMFFAASVAAAFTVDDPMDALHIGLEEIPANCLLAQAVRWALDLAPGIHNYQQANAAVTAQFPDMHHVHTINNACLTIFGLSIGGRDFSRIISQTVAMGYDVDCTAATAGSIAGAVYGVHGIPEYWWKRFDNTVRTYLNGPKYYQIDDLIDRFARQANRVTSV